MKIIIIGCGRVGSGLARMLSNRDHQVTMIDSDPLSFERLGKNYKGKTVVGIGFDRQTLLDAGIEKADAFAAVTASDEANAVAARIAKNRNNLCGGRCRSPVCPGNFAGQIEGPGRLRSKP